MTDPATVTADDLRETWLPVYNSLHQSNLRAMWVYAAELDATLAVLPYNDKRRPELTVEAMEVHLYLAANSDEPPAVYDMAAEGYETGYQTRALVLG